DGHGCTQMKKKLLSVCICVHPWLILTGCRSYAEFTLPSPAEPARNIRFTFNPRPSPVLGRGTGGEFDYRDALNPAVVSRDGVLYNFYSGFDGKTWRTG